MDLRTSAADVGNGDEPVGWMHRHWSELREGFSGGFGK